MSLETTAETVATPETTATTVNLTENAALKVKALLD